ncbi:hypothetical protein RchiOBHm_Chr2g0142591 [Rosa chinensis]|uniref:Uncharacterized protein n=1 Tax=Rosa chinensis TaxID=74649 RepID=A0A2P6RXW1_ROSCH|nr:hypothetical protein RchiOBHm_Chr2g0142591 [Rosa chinensis]
MACQPSGVLAFCLRCFSPTYRQLLLDRLRGGNVLGCEPGASSGSGRLCFIQGIRWLCVLGFEAVAEVLAGGLSCCGGWDCVLPSNSGSISVHVE